MAVRIPMMQNHPAGWPTEDARLITAYFQPSSTSGLHGMGGVLPAPPGFMGEVTLLGPEAILVNPARWVVPGTQSGVQGDYVVCNDAAAERVIGPRDPTLTRIDRLVVQVRDTAYTPNEGVDDPDVRVIPGVPSATGAVAPDVPANALSLGTISVPTAGGTVTFTPVVLSQQVPVGGIRPVRLSESLLAALGGHEGQFRDHPQWGLQRWSQASGLWDDTIIDRLRFNNVGDVGPTTTGHPFQIGPDDGPNLAMDSNQIQGRDAGAVAPLWINTEEVGGARGEVGLGFALFRGGTTAQDRSQYQAIVTPRLRIIETNDAQAHTTAGDSATPSIYHPFQLGLDTEQHVLMDTNEAFARTALTGQSASRPEGTGGGVLAPFTWHALQVNEPSLDGEPVRRGTLNGNSALANHTGWQTASLSSSFTTFSGGPGARWIYMNGQIHFSFGLARGTAWGGSTTILTWNTTWRPRYDQYFVAVSMGRAWGECKIEASTGVMMIVTGAADWGGSGNSFAVSGSFVPVVVF